MKFSAQVLQGQAVTEAFHVQSYSEDIRMICSNLAVKKKD
ncbi:hypothetical protein [Paenibacillus sp. FSL R7-0331]